MVRVVLACDDEAYCTEICEQLQDQADKQDLVVFARKMCELLALTSASEFVPDLVVLVASSGDDPEMSGAVKLSLPDVPLFLVTERFSLEMEKDALSCGIEAVFQKDHDFLPLITNIRAMKKSRS
jgi:DNA-binding response OmpR family regulator